MALRVIATLISLFLALPVSAQEFISCSKSEISQAQEAIAAAEKIALTAAVSIGDTPEYRRWFGFYTKANAAEVRANFKAIHSVLRNNEVKVLCAAVGQEDCTADMFANVWQHDAYRINLCPAFFEMPRIHVFANTSSQMENGTRAGTIIHEVSHFAVVANTDDICYTRTTCSEMALQSRRLLVDNADSYQYFAEDIAYQRRLTGASTSDLQ